MPGRKTVNLSECGLEGELRGEVMAKLQEWLASDGSNVQLDLRNTLKSTHIKDAVTAIAIQKDIWLYNRVQKFWGQSSDFLGSEFLQKSVVVDNKANLSQER